MAFLELEIFSWKLQHRERVNVIMPQGQELAGVKFDGKKPKLLFLLHGLSDNHSMWARYTQLERFALQHNVCIVMPSGGRSFYTDMKYGGKYYSYIAKELPQIIANMFNISDKREDHAIAGLSMGGYGALKIGMRECDYFGYAAGVSSVADILEGEKHFPSDMVNVFGEDMNVCDEDDLFKLAEKTNSNPNKPKIYMAVGKSDFLYDANIRLRDKFNTLDFDYTYEEAEGAHTWEFWNEYVQHVLSWFDKND